jgi:CIC family chloride channel protein
MPDFTPKRTAAPARPFRWFPEFLSLSQRRLRSQVRLLGLAVLVGIVAGIGAIVFYLATRVVEHYALGYLMGYQAAPHPGGEVPLPWLPVFNEPFQPWLLLLIPTVGGILSGVLVYTFAPEAEGHGTDAVIEAYHQRQGDIRPRVPIVKIVASALTLGTGGSGGREGPIAQIGAGFGSVLGKLLRLRPADRRVLVAAGMGAGIAAIFRAPLAGTIFAAEVLYRSSEFEPEVIIPAGIASVVSYCVFGAYTGWRPLFTTPDLTFTNPWQLGPYLLLALFMVLLAMLNHVKPAIGALLTGLIAFVLYYLLGRSQHVLAVLAFGYSAVQEAITQDAGVSVLLLLCVALGKIFTTSFTISSGGSGGVFGPSMVIGGSAGGALGILLHGFILSDEQSIYSSQVESRSLSPAHQGAYVHQVLAQVRVSQFLIPGQVVPYLHPDDPLDSIITMLGETSYPVLPVVDEKERLLGVVNLEEVHLASRAPSLVSLVIAEDLMRSDIRPLTPVDRLDHALELFVENDLLALPIVNDLQERRVLGIVRRFDIASAYLRHVHGPGAAAVRKH